LQEKKKIFFKYFRIFPSVKEFFRKWFKTFLPKEVSNFYITPLKLGYKKKIDSKYLVPPNSYLVPLNLVPLEQVEREFFELYINENIFLIHFIELKTS
jgi:hypothetical protein